MKFADIVRRIIWLSIVPFRTIAIFILLTVFYSLPRTMNIRERYCRFWYHNFFVRLNYLRKRILPAYVTVRKRTHGNYQLEPLPKNTENEDIVVRFSGGPDSTLASAIMAERFRKVHLLTFGHAGSPLKSVAKSKIAVGYLSKKYGSDKFIHKIYSLEELRSKFYFKDYFVDFLKFGFYRSNACAACYFSQHMKVISYCKKYGIRYATDGITHVRGNYVALSQMFTVAQGMKKLYNEYGLHYIINPSYNLDRSDHELYARGIMPIKDIKFTEHHHETQSSCGIGRFLVECAKGYYFVIHGRSCLRKIAPRYFQYKYKIFKQLIDDKISSRGI